MRQLMITMCSGEGLAKVSGRRRIGSICFHACWLALALPSTTVALAGWDLTPEDLERALERGDLAALDYERLLDLFRLRHVAAAAVTDDSVSSSADIGSGAIDSLISSSATAMPRVRGAAYEVYRRLRGAAARREWLLLAPEVHSIRVHVELERSGAGDWRVLRRHVWWRSSQASIVAGSFDAHWVDGLLIGAAPAFLHRRERLAETLLFPDRGRLNGMLCELDVLGTHAAAVVSRLDDGELSHSAYGLAIARRVAGAELETAYLRQALCRTGQSLRFTAGLWGLAAERRVRATVGSGALAIGPEDWAAQGRLDVAESPSHRLGVAIWRAGPRFRNPLMKGAMESDRESVNYPELDWTASNAATGERGGEVRLQVGRSGRRSDFALRYWRERPERSASLRASAAYALGRSGRRWRGEYRLYRRTDGSDVRHRHEWSIRTSSTRGYCDIKLRRTAGNWSPFGELGGRAELGVRVAGGATGRQRQSVVFTYNDYDFAQRRSAFWTVRSSQSLQFSRSVRLNVNLQWRTAYHAHPTEVSLRITTRGGP